MGKYSKWNCVLCKELCEHMDCFEKEPTLDNLCIIEKLTSVIRDMQNMEFSGAMRHFAEEHFGYDEESGRIKFPEDSGWDEHDFDIYDVYDAYDARRRRDSRGRYMSRRGGRRGAYNMYDNIPYPPYYNMDEEEDERVDGMMPMQNAAGRNGTSGGNYSRSGRAGGSNGSDGRSNGMGMNNAYHGGRRMPPYYSDGEDDMMYRVRQMNGRPIMEPMYNHMDMKDKPKKLTDKQIEEWMKEIENSDGTRGTHFTKEQVKQMAQKLGVKYEDFSESELYAASNMAYADYCSTLEGYTKSPEAYVKLAIDFLDDDDFYDSPSVKLALYYNNIVEHKE